MRYERGRAGLLGFLLTLATVGSARADAAPAQPIGEKTLDARLTRLSVAFHEAESEMQLVPSNDPVYVAYGFLNSAPSFRNSSGGGWLNRVSGWHNTGVFHNSGSSFLNNLHGFRNAFVGWPNRVSGWHNGGSAGFRNGGGFVNGGGFRNGGGFHNGGGFKNGGGFFNR
jgi:rSAM-associated Gly-rich repeat protein